jgi:CRISPR-associated protein Cas1
MIQKTGPGDVVNQCISAATSCLYGISEAAILAAGYAPAIGFIHSGKPLSFVYDIADIIKFDSVVPKAFEIAAAILRSRIKKSGWPVAIFSAVQS